VNCEETQRLLHAYIDDELDMANSLEVEQHLQGCVACARDYENYRALRAAIKGNSLYFQTPASLQKRVQAAIPRVRRVSRSVHLPSWRWLSIAALLLLFLGASGFWGFTQLHPSSSPDNHQAQLALDNHERSLVDNHLLDISSSDQQTVRTWFEGKLGFSPPVIDLTSQGFSLVGGRLDFLDGRAVAAIVYRCGDHVVNLFAWPSTRNVDMRTISLQGYYLTHWTKYGMDCWAVADLDEGELQQFARLIDQHLESLL
jgi:anti-sigma factor RsiW